MHEEKEKESILCIRGFRWVIFGLFNVKIFMIEPSTKFCDTIKKHGKSQNVALLKLDKFKPYADSLWSFEGDLLCKFL